MGNIYSRAHNFGWMMAWRNAEPQRCLQSTPRGRPLLPESRGGPARSIMHPHEDDDTVEVTEDPFPSGRISMMQRFTSMLTKSSSNETELKLESELKEKMILIDKLMSSLRAQDQHIRNLTIDLDQVRLYNQEIQAANVQEVQCLNSLIEEREADLKDQKYHASQFKTKCLKLEAQLALIEQKAAQESLKSGSYSDDHANPGMLEGACKAVDKATEDLARVLHNSSVTKLFPLNSPELEQFVRQIGPAHPAEFSRPIQVKYVWAHWICFQMFQGFEHVFFDADGGQLTSPLDSKKHALECFRSFQQQQSASSSDSYGIFQAFFSWKYRSVFPPWLVKQAFIPKDVVCNENGRFDGDGEIFESFTDVARSVWLLHELAFSFDPPASILWMARGTPYDKQFHEAVIHVEDGPGPSSQMISLMIRPAFRVRKSIIRSRVFLRKLAA